MLKPPIANPLLVLMVHRALLNCPELPNLDRGWMACYGLMPADDRQAEVLPAEWFNSLPLQAQSHIDEAINSDFFRIAAGLKKGGSGHPDPELLSALLYDNGSSSGFSKLSEKEVLAVGKPWPSAYDDPTWIIEARPFSNAWVEMDPADDYDARVVDFSLKMGAGIWFHPPTRKSTSSEKNPALVGVWDAVLDTPGWDQWVFPLSEALQSAILARINPEGLGNWSSIAKSSKWPGLPDWIWSHAETIHDNCFGGFIAAIAWRLMQRECFSFSR